ncbi:MAG: 3-oxoacyl-ACP reductase FabG [Verrucomicrobia bacterium]|nr:3-oxoacyl-ACP reductase FabG [Verrucomicrobiota bacterium]
MNLFLKNKVALVTGGARGLGRAICLALAEEGARVAVNALRSDPEELVAQLRTQFGIAAIAVRGDVSKSEAVRAVFDRVEQELGPLDILVNNAGTWPTAFVKDMTDKQWSETLAVNLTGSFNTCREAVRRWLAAGRKGRIVNITSQAAYAGATTGHAHYAVAKAGLANLTVSLAREMAPHGILVNAVAPGFMETDMAAEALRQDRERILSRIPLGRIADPAEVAAAVVFLASERASYITGATLDVNGGMLMR